MQTKFIILMCVYVPFLLSLSGCGPPWSSSKTPPSAGTADTPLGALPATGGGARTSPEPAPAGKGVGGAVDSIDVYGTVSGWARDAQNAGDIASVYFFADGNAATGMAMGSVIANQPGPEGANSGHYFFYQLPDNWRDGKPHTIYAYASSAVEAHLLSGSATTFVAYVPRTVGQLYYNQTLLPILQTRCAPCHTPSYSYHYTFLATPTPFGGGTALHNALINKPSGAVAHFGGNLCGDKNSAPCLQMQQWWKLEFE